MLKMKEQGKKILSYIFIIVVIIVALEILIVSFAKNLDKKEISVIENQENVFVNSGNATFVSMRLPAVDSEGKGVSTILNVEAVKGKGRTLVDIDNLLFWADTQHSIRIARLVADNFTNVSVDNYDLIYNIQANASLIGGPSAGAAITLATIFALRGEEPRQDVMVTGTINHDGSIGPVSAILEKAKASKEAGAKIFLVPLLQSKDVVYETKKYCQRFGFTEICHQENIPKKIDVSEEAGIKVLEVENIEEAIKYFESS